ncbi:MAG: spiro-SPASM protein [Spirochaetales bacterium]|jgi:spiro-SPASM protein|nr:spiro-SPASM protein [Spirochaetales bacterium]
MANLVVINLADGQYFARSLAGRPVIDWALDYAKTLVPEKDIAFLTTGGAKVPPFKTLTLESQTDAALIKTLTELAAAYDNIIYIFGDSPFLDIKTSLRMLENHAKYYAHYTFADGYPAGLTPEIIAVRTLPALAALCKEPQPVSRETLFTLIQKDINAFDLETELSPTDMRLLRASLTVDTKRNHLLCERIAAALPEAAYKPPLPGTTESRLVGKPTGAAVISLLEDKTEILRTLPAFVAVQITEGCPHACAFCPYPLLAQDVTAKKGFMRPQDFDIIAGKTADFCGDAVIGVSLWGEPSQHPAFLQIAQSIAVRPGLKLLVETSGIGWTDEVIRECAKMLEGRLTWIVSLDAVDSGQYTKLRGSGWDEALARANMLLAEFAGSAYVQALRMADNEETLETFYRTWKEKTNHLIIQKYDFFCGFLPQRKVTDLSPLDRFPCRHLQRDMSVLLDGSVPLCREDIQKTSVLGNLITDDIQAIWDKAGGFYREQLDKNYSNICGKCDEYYTYNF